MQASHHDWWRCSASRLERSSKTSTSNDVRITSDLYAARAPFGLFCVLCATKVFWKWPQCDASSLFPYDSHQLRGNLGETRSFWASSNSVEKLFSWHKHDNYHAKLEIWNWNNSCIAIKTAGMRMRKPNIPCKKGDTALPLWNRRENARVRERWFVLCQKECFLFIMARLYFNRNDTPWCVKKKKTTKKNTFFWATRIRSQRLACCHCSAMGKPVPASRIDGEQRYSPGKRVTARRNLSRKRLQKQNRRNREGREPNPSRMGGERRCINGRALRTLDKILGAWS